MDTQSQSLKAALLGETKMPKRGGYKPDKRKILEPIPKGAIMNTFCSRCNRYYPIDYEMAQDFAKKFDLEFPAKEKLRTFLIMYDGCICCRYHNPEKSYESVKIVRISDIK
jgi:hypothetical protein